MRFIDWSRGSPYVFLGGDLPEILRSNCLFARKFDERVDLNIVKTVLNQFKLER